jgi:hypothetical protein
MTYMVGIIPLNLRSQETYKGVPRARAHRRRRRLGRSWRGVARQGEAGRRRAGGRGVVVLNF